MTDQHPESKGNLFEQTYPYITRFIKTYGWIEIGSDHYSSSLIRALDEGGLVWESGENYPTVDAALQELEIGLEQWMEEQGLE